MKNRIFLFLAGLVFTLSSCSSLQPALITNVQELHSTLLDKDPSAMTAINTLPKRFRKNNRIITFSNEGSWPSGMRTLMDRYNNKETIKQYKTEVLTSFSSAEKGKLFILRVPKRKNKNMPGTFRPMYDFFMVIGEEGIQLQ